MALDAAQNLSHVRKECDFRQRNWTVPDIETLNFAFWPHIVELHCLSRNQTPRRLKKSKERQAQEI